MKKRKNNLDEMQEQELLRIEHNGCWLAFWLLLAAMVVQSIFNRNMDFRTLAGEWIVFMILALYLAFACMRKGIWDRRLGMNRKTNLVISLIAGAALGIFQAVMVGKYVQRPDIAAATAGISAVITFVLCFGALTIMMNLTRKRNAEMEAEPADTEE